MENANREIYRLTYASIADASVDDECLAEISEIAREKNSAVGITGLLIHHKGEFLQFLEGDRKVVEETFKRIEKDYRHRAAVVIGAEYADDRLFPNWEMGCLDMGDAADPTNMLFDMAGVNPRLKSDAFSTAFDTLWAFHMQRDRSHARADEAFAAG